MIPLIRLGQIALLMVFVGGVFTSGSVAAQPAGADGADAQRVGASQLYEKALVEYNLGQVRVAYIHLKNALLNDPFLLSAHLLLGKIYLELGQGERAEKELLIADGLGAHQTLTLIPLARAYLQQGKSQKLLDELYPLNTLPEEDAELLALRGQAHLDLEQYYEAQRAFTQAWERNQNNVSAVLGRIRVLLLKGELSEADFYSRRATELAPDNPETWYLRGRLSRGLGDIASALKDFEQAVEVMPAYLPAWLAKTSVQLELGRFDQALESARRARELYPNDPRGAYLEAVVQARRGETGIAGELLGEAQLQLSQLPPELLESHGPTLLLAGMVAYGLKRWTQASGYLTLYLEKFPDSVGPRVILAQLHLDNHKPEQAIKLLEPAAALAPGTQKILSLLAEAYLRDGQYVRAAQYLREAIEVDEDNPILATQRAINAFGLGRRSRAIAEMTEVFESHPGLRVAGASLVVMSLKERRFDEAVSVARTLLQDSPYNLAYLNLYGVALMTAGEHDAARWAFELALLLDWRFDPAQVNLAELDLREGSADAARERLELLYARNRRLVRVMLMLARACEAQGDLETARDWAQRAVGADPSSVPIAVYLTDLLLKMQESSRALELVESAQIRSEDANDMDLVAALSRAYLANGYKATAQVALQRASSLAGYDGARLLEVALLQWKAGDIKGAIWSLEKAVKGQPNYLPARIKLGEIYQEIGDSALANDVAKALARDFPDQPFGNHLAGVIALARGDNQSALARFKAAFNSQPSSVLAIRVYETVQKVDGSEPALDFLSEWVAGHPDDSVANQAYAEALYRAGRAADAERYYERVLAESPDNPLLLNNLALIYAREKKSGAVELAQKAFELRPDSAEITDTLGWVLVLSGQPDQGLKHLRDAQVIATAPGGVDYHVAYALEKLGRYAEAERTVATALERGGDFPEREAAEVLRDRLREQRRQNPNQQRTSRSR